MKRIGVMTSGGDAPGMNACIRAVVRSGIYNGLEVIGIKRGYTGMIEGDFTQMDLRSVSNILQRGGTILKTSRCEEFLTREGRELAAKRLKEANIEGVILIGGDGTFRGGVKLASEFRVKVVGVPGTIDNDVYGTEFTIGYDTAVNTALDAIDKIRDTAASHDLVFFVEVMGRTAGFIALEAGVGGGAEEILIPETHTNINELANRLKEGIEKGKTSSIVVVAEGDETGDAVTIAKEVKRLVNINYRVTVLGHIQRGGTPTAKDRLLASRLGNAAVEALLNGKENIMVGEINQQITYTPLKETYLKKKLINKELVKLASILSI